MHPVDPKVLIISGYAPPATHGSGLMMYNLISQFPQNSLVVLTETFNKDESLSTYKLNAPYYTYGGSIATYEIQKNAPVFSVANIKNIVRKTPGMHILGELFFLLYLIQRIVKVGRKAVAKEQPTMLVGYSDIGPNLISTYLLHKITKTPYSLFFYDLYLGNKMPSIFSIAARIFERRILTNASHIFVMCDPLKKHYEETYSLNNITVIYNSILPPQIKQENFDITRPKNQAFTVAYIGNTYWAQEQSLINLHKALASITEFPTKLKIYSHSTREHLNSLGLYENESTEFTKCLPEEVLTELVSADVAFIGLSFDTKYPNLINTSSPGRLCDFLQSNTPILVHAPKESFITQYSKKHNFAYTVDENSVPKLKETLIKIQGDSRENEIKITNAHKVNETNHNAHTNAKLYFNILTK